MMVMSCFPTYMAHNRTTEVGSAKGSAAFCYAYVSLYTSAGFHTLLRCAEIHHPAGGMFIFIPCLVPIAALVRDSHTNAQTRAQMRSLFL